MREAMRQKPERSGRQEREAGEARQASGLDEAERPRRATNDTGPGLLTAVLARENREFQNMMRIISRVDVAG
jgi:RNA-directed DNA polymerase